MKRIKILAITVIIALATNIQVFSQEKSISANSLNNISFSLYGGANIPTNGDYQSSLQSTDLLEIGPQFGLGVSYFFYEGLGVEAIINYGYNTYKDEYKIAGKETTLSNLSISINGVYNFDNMFSQSMVSPLVRAGVGMYNWSVLDDGIGGEVIQIGSEDLNATSFGFNLGIGADFKVASNMTVGIIVDYNMYFPKDEDKFGTDFAEQGYVTPQLKFSYYLPVK